MEQDIQEILFSQEALARRVKELAGEIRRDYAGKAPLVVGVLRGCFVFMADLVRELDFPLTLDFMAASSYHGTESSGKVNIQLDLHDDIAGRDVLLDKPERRVRPLEADYVGFTIPDAFVVGYGLDYEQQYRNLPYVGILKPSVYQR